MNDEILATAIALLAATPARWVTLVRAAPLEVLVMKPALTEWSALECLQHLVETERLAMPVRLKALLAEQSFPGFTPAQHGSSGLPTRELADEFSQLRQENLAVLAHVTAADLAKRALHAEYGVVTLREFLHHWVGHDLMHTVQAERALLQPFIRGCGPWHVNYTEHRVLPPAEQ